ncbi:acyltransferase [Streptomyces sp. ISL-66]|uniref:acyltransferase family protein n=1 Tax=Streptomyces sp. ISL-66 TaxID=2819186 RepID=UPI002552FA45|nr:acyltransferase [Streptomyces sp. ISL-66]
MLSQLIQSPPREVAAVSAPAAGKRPRLAALDGLRLLAALMVVFHHYVGYGGNAVAAKNAWTKPVDVVFPTASWLASYTWTGVEFFFLISGFVICMSSWGRGLGEFFTSRVVRLYPAYWFAILATTAVVTLWPLVVQPLGPQDTLLNFTMLQEPFRVGSVDAVYWTLWVEVRFYLLFALVVWKGVTYRRVVLFCVLWTVASVLVTSGRAPLAAYVLMPEYSPYFIAGVAMYLMHRFRPTMLLWGIVAVSWLFSVRQVSLYNDTLASSLGRTMDSKPAVVLMTLGYLVMIILALGGLSWVRGKWLTVAGATTYPLYLLHEHIGWTGIRLLRHHLSPWALVAAMTLGMLATAWLVHRFIERPLSAILKRGITRSLDPLRRNPASTGATGTAAATVMGAGPASAQAQAQVQVQGPTQEPTPAHGPAPAPAPAPAPTG